MKGLHLDGRNNGQEKKDLLLGLLKHHGIGEDKKGDGAGYEVNDPAADKGKGLVILLYGTPGVGKTMTAQMVAVAAGKPLFSIGVADVDTKPEHGESNLEKVFSLATTWKAILLIDEADVVLQSRTAGLSTAESSGLLSVFLRVLEYYRDILFLTTNHIATFDVAVQSRIHIAMKYEPLTQDQTYSIFVDVVRLYTEKGLVSKQEDWKRFAMNLYKKKLDGRQIRNVVMSAISYAKGRNDGEGKMTLEDVQDVLVWVEDFKTDLAGQMRTWQNTQKLTRLD